MKYLIITFGYQSYAIPYTEKVAAALPDILTVSKVQHKTGDVYSKDATRVDLSITIGEAENGNN